MPDPIVQDVERLRSSSVRLHRRSSDDKVWQVEVLDVTVGSEHREFIQSVERVGKSRVRGVVSERSAGRGH